MNRSGVTLLFVLFCSSQAFGQRLLGRLDWADHNEVRGFGCDQQYPSDDVTMNVYIDNNIYAGTCTANQAYSGDSVSSCGGGSGNRGFRLQFNEGIKSILKSGRHSITVKAVSVRTTTRIIVIDGCPVNIPVQPTPYPTPFPTPFPTFVPTPFPTPFPTFVPTPFPTEVPTPTFIPGRTEGFVTGFFDSANTTAAFGWACDPTQPAIRLQVNFYVDNTVFAGSAVANIPREAAVASQCGGDSAHGFSVVWSQNIKSLLRDGNQHFVSVFAVPFPTGNPVQLPNSPIRVLYFCTVPSATASAFPSGRVDFPPSGMLESATTTRAVGWACDPSNPNTALFVDFYVNTNYYAGRALANVQRDNAVSQQCGGSANHGFTMYFASNVQQYIQQQRNQGAPVRLSAILNYGTGRTQALTNSPLQIAQ